MSAAYPGVQQPQHKVIGTAERGRGGTREPTTEDRGTTSQEAHTITNSTQGKPTLLPVVYTRKSAGSSYACSPLRYKPGAMLRWVRNRTRGRDHGNQIVSEGVLSSYRHGIRGGELRMLFYTRRYDWDRPSRLF